jgi:hypothetical protein
MKKKKTKIANVKSNKAKCECNCVYKSLLGKIRSFVSKVVAKIKSIL